MVDLIIRKADLPRYVGLRRTAIEDLIQRGEFPRPIKLSDRAVGFLASEIEAWQLQRIAERDGEDGADA
jgi:prophage regulatory protein